MDKEEFRILPDSLVIGHRNLDALDAGLIPALAQDRHRVGARLQRSADALDPLVDLAEQRLVASDPSFSLFHSHAILSLTLFRLATVGDALGQ